MLQKKPLNTIKENLSFWGEVLLILAFFLPFFLPIQNKFLPFPYYLSFFGATLIVTTGCLLAAIYLFRKASNLSIGRMDVLFTVLVLYGILSWSVHPYSYWFQGGIFVWILFFLQFFIFKLLFKQINYQHTYVALAIVTILEVIIGQFQILGLFSLSFSISGSEISGTFPDFKSYIGFLSIVLPLAIYEALKKDDVVLWQKHLSWVLIGCILLIIIPSKSNIAFLGILISGLYILFHRFPLFYKARNTESKLVIFIVILYILSFGTFSFLGSPSIKPPLQEGLLIQKVSSRMWDDSPFLGIGLNRFEAEYNLAQANYFLTEGVDSNEMALAKNHSDPPNEFSRIFVEWGLFGFLVWGLLLFFAFGEKGTEKDAISIKAGLLSWIVFSLFLPSISIWGISLLCCLFLAFLTKNSPPLFRIPDSSASNLIQKGVFPGLFIIAACFSASWLFKSYPAAQNWGKGEVYFSNAEYNKSILQYEKVYNSLKYEGMFLNALGRAYLLNGKHQKSLNIFTRAQNYYMDAKAYCNMGISYTELEQFKEAKEVYKIAHYMVPNYLYPNFLLVRNLYRSGEVQAAKELAIQVLSKDLEIKTETTEAMVIELKMIADI